MKKAISTFVMGFICALGYAQDSIPKPRMLLRPYFENGINFLRNDLLKQNYATQSMYYWGFGLQLGKSGIHNTIPYIQYTLSSFEVEKQLLQNIKSDRTLSINQISAGFIFPIKCSYKTYLRVRLGYNYSMIKESVYNIDSNSNGFQFGVGIERRIFGSLRAYCDFSYNYQKTKSAEFRDFDMTRLSLGFIL